MRATKLEIEEAKQFPDGWVYRIHPGYDKDGEVPPFAIIGAWKVGKDGFITGEFISNPKYDANKSNTQTMSK